MVPLPTPRSFVVVQLDPVDSVAHLDNPELTEACRRLTNKKYLAYVGHRDGLFWPDVPYYGYDFYFVHQGLKCEDDLQETVDPGMCASVLPNTSHPFGRQPLDPGEPLPWNDCYVSPFFTVFARCRTIVVEKDPSMAVSIDDAVRWLGYVDEDRQNLSEQLAPPQQQASSPPTKVPCADSPDNQDSKDGIKGSWNPTREMERAAKLEDLLDEIEELDDELMNLAVVQASFDVIELDKVNDPAEFMAELKAFERLKDELVKGEKRRKIEDARRIDEEHFGKLYQSGSHTPPTSGASPSLTPSPNPVCPASLRARGAKLLRTVRRRMKKIIKFFHS